MNTAIKQSTGSPAAALPPTLPMTKSEVSTATVDATAKQKDGLAWLARWYGHIAEMSIYK